MRKGTGRRQISPERIAAIEQMLLDGHMGKTIIETLRTATATIADVRREMIIAGRLPGIPTIPKHERMIGDARTDRIREMADAGYNVDQIAADVRLGIQQVRRRLRLVGVRFPADIVAARHKRINPNTVIERIAIDLTHHVTDLLHLVDITDLDPKQIPLWVAALHEANRQLAGFIRRLEKECKRYAETAESGRTETSITRV